MSRREAVDPQWRETLAGAGLVTLVPLLERSPVDAMLPGQWESLAKPGLGRRERWRWRLRGDAPNEVVFVKRYSHTGIKNQWDRMLRQIARRSRAFWEFERSQELSAASISAPRAVGYAEEMRGWFESRSTVLLESVKGRPLDAFWNDAQAASATVARGATRHDFMCRIGRFVAAFHGTGLCHRDLYLCHLFVDADFGGVQPPRFAIIDLARAHRPRLGRMRWIIKDLAQLEYSARHAGFSRSDRLRILTSYLSLDAGQPRVRWYVRRIVAKADAIERREVRKGRLGPHGP